MKVLLCIAMNEESGSLQKKCKFSLDKKTNLLKTNVGDNSFHLLITGMGKINAAYRLASVLSQGSFDLVLNIGFAGTTNPNYILGTVFQVRSVSEWDVPASQRRNIDLTMLDLNCSQGKCLTGDYICSVRNSVTLQSDVVDMECYPLSYICRDLGIPFVSLKMISDYCSDNSWSQIERNSKYLSEKLADFLLEEVFPIIGKS